MEEQLIDVGGKPYIIVKCDCGGRNVFKLNIWKSNPDLICGKCKRKLKRDGRY